MTVSFSTGGLQGLVGLFPNFHGYLGRAPWIFWKSLISFSTLAQVRELLSVAPPPPALRHPAALPLLTKSPALPATIAAGPPLSSYSPLTARPSMKQAHSLTVRGSIRALAGAAISACLVASIGLVSSSAAEPAAAPAAPRDEAQMRATHDAMGRHWAQHVQGHLDKLAERLEIKASQEAAWQKFSAAFRDTMGLQATMGHPQMGDGGRAGDGDATALARQMADRAKERAQKLGELADATAALRQGLNPDQRLVLDEAARHFAREHGRGNLESMAAGGHHGMMGDHCERGGTRGEGLGEYDEPHHRWEHGEGPHGSATEPQSEADAANEPNEPGAPARPQGQAVR